MSASGGCCGTESTLSGCDPRNSHNHAYHALPDCHSLVTIPSANRHQLRGEVTSALLALHPDGFDSSTFLLQNNMEQEIDGWIAQLSQCKQLTEVDVKRLCDKVRGFYLRL